MKGGTPITDAVYGRKRGANPRPSRRSRPRRTGILLAAQLGEEKVAEVYARLGFTPGQSQQKKQRRG